MYIDGWTVNELCKKFGAAPYTIKHTIWSVNYFFEEMVPK